MGRANLGPTYDGGCGLSLAGVRGELHDARRRLGPALLDLARFRRDGQRVQASATVGVGVGAANVGRTSGRAESSGAGAAVAAVPLAVVGAGFCRELVLRLGEEGADGGRGGADVDNGGFGAGPDEGRHVGVGWIVEGRDVRERGDAGGCNGDHAAEE